MADQKTQDSGAVTMTKSDLAAIVAAAVSQAVKATNEYVDPIVEANKTRMKTSMKALRVENERNREYRESLCSHRRDDNSSRVAWIDNWVARTGRVVREGFCQGCEKHFHPEIDPVAYMEMVKVSTGKNTGY